NLSSSHFCYQAEDAIRDFHVTGVQTCALPIWAASRGQERGLRLVILTSVLAFLLMLLARGKPYYIAPIWPAVIGIGLGHIDERLRAMSPEDAHRMSAGHRATLALLWFLVAAWGAVALPLGLPILPPGQMSRYADR